MWIKDWWNRMLKKFKKDENISEAESVMELKSEEAPEPVPERKTSDEMIVTMAESARQDRDSEPEEPNDSEDPAEPEEPNDSEDPVESEESYEKEGPEAAEDPFDIEDPADPDPAEAVTWQEAEEDEKKDAGEEY